MEMDTIIEVTPKDSDDGLYCAIVMIWHKESKTWINSGNVVREDTPEKAFSCAKALAIEDGIWE